MSGQASQAISVAGVLFQRGDGATPEVFTTMNDISEVGGFEESLSLIETTHLNSPDNVAEYVGGKKDNPAISLAGSYVLTDPQQQGLRDDLKNRTRRNFRILYPTPLNHIASFTAIVTMFKTTAKEGGKLDFSGSLKPTGPITITHD